MDEASLRANVIPAATSHPLLSSNPAISGHREQAGIMRCHLMSYLHIQKIIPSLVLCKVQRSPAVPVQ